MDFIANCVSVFISNLGVIPDRNPVDINKLDYGQYDQTKSISEKPFTTIEKGIHWYSNHSDFKILPENIIIAIVAKHFEALN